MSADDPDRALERHVAVQRARRQNIFSARGALACRENALLASLGLAAAVLWLAQIAFSASDERLRPRLALPAGQLVVAVLDVRQGDAIFVQTPDLVRVLIDAGPSPTDRDPFDAGRDKIVPWLREHGVERLDAFVISHAHADHIGGLAYLLQAIPVDRVLDPGFALNSDIYERALRIIESSEGRIQYRIVQQGERLELGKDVIWQVLAPPQPPIAGTRSDCNSNSIVLRLAYGATSFLFMGDAEEETEHLLADYGEGLRATFLKVAHHGSRYSSSEHFLHLVRPRHALISCGRNNPFGHPHEEALDRLGGVGASVHRTDESGDLMVITDGTRYKVVESRTAP